MSTGAASPPAPSGCCGPARCRRFPAWVIRWSPVTNRSAAWSKLGIRRGFARRPDVFVPGAKCFGEVRGLFGASASRLVVPAKRVMPIDAQNSASRAFCWRWPRRPITRSRRLARRRRTASSVMACSDACSRASRSRSRRCRADRVGEQPGARRWRHRLRRHRSRARSAPRLHERSTMSAATAACSIR